MGVVAPVTGVGAAVIPVVVGVLLGERPAPAGLGRHRPRLAGHLAGGPRARPAVSGRRPGGACRRRAGRAWGSASSSSPSAQIADDAGLLPLAVNQVVAALVIVVVASLLAPALAAARVQRVLGGVRRRASSAPCATVCFLLATREGYLSVASVADLALPGVHGGAGRDRAPRARPPRTGSGSAAVRGGRDAGRGGLALSRRQRPGRTLTSAALTYPRRCPTHTW